MAAMETKIEAAAKAVSELRTAVDKALKYLSESDVRRAVEQELNSRR